MILPLVKCRYLWALYTLIIESCLKEAIRIMTYTISIASWIKWKCIRHDSFTKYAKYKIFETSILMYGKGNSKYT